MGYRTDYSLMKSLMMNSSNEIMHQMEVTIKELVELTKEICVYEEEVLNKIVPIAVRVLQFEGIYKQAYLNEEHLYADVDYCKDERGVILRGVKVHSTLEDTCENEEYKWQFYKEIFFLDNGMIKAFDTFYTEDECSCCEGVRYQIERLESNKSNKTGYKNELSIEHILIALQDRVKELESRNGMDD
ncbi:hypothetical protein ACFCP7_24545 [Paenibacillus elgii]